MMKQLLQESKYALVIVITISFFAAVSITWSATSTFTDGIVVGGGSLTNGLMLDVDGKIGATSLCDDDNLNCVTTSEIYSVVSVGGYPQIFEDGVNIGIGISPLQKLHVGGNVRADGRHIFLGSSQDLYGDNGSALYYDSNDSDVSQIILRDVDNDPAGSLYGQSTSGYISLVTPNGDVAVYGYDDGVSVLRYDDVDKLLTSSAGVTVNGSVIVSGSVTASAGVTVNGSVIVSGSVTANDFLYSSDERLKHNIQSIRSGLETVLDLQGVSFDWNENGEPSIGFIAQQIEQVVPDLVDTDDETGYKSVRYGSINAYLVEAIKEQQIIIEDQQRQINELRVLMNEISN